MPVMCIEFWFNALFDNNVVFFFFYFCGAVFWGGKGFCNYISPALAENKPQHTWPRVPPGVCRLSPHPKECSSPSHT